MATSHFHYELLHFSRRYGRSVNWVGTLLLLLTGSVVFAQQYVLAGRAVNGASQEEAVPFATVLLLEEGKDEIVDAVVADLDGKFTITLVSTEGYALRISGIGFTTQEISLASVATRGPDAELTIPLSPQAAVLETVEVKARKRSRIEHDGQGMVVHLSDTDRLQSGDLEELITQLPGVFMLNGQLSIEGMTGATVMLNGQPFAGGYELLSAQVHPEDVLRVEIRKNPGATFAAEGSGGIINVITRHRVDEGLHAMASIRTNYLRDPRLNGLAFVSYGKGKFQLASRISGGRFQYLDSTRIAIYDPERRFVNNKFHGRERTTLRVGNEVMFEPTANLSFRLVQRYFRNQQDGNRESVVNLRQEGPQGASEDRIVSGTDESNRWEYHNLDLFSTVRNFLGGALKSDMSLAFFSPRRDEIVRVDPENSTILDLRRRFEYGGRSRFGAVAANYERTQEGMTFNLGFRTSYSHKEDDLRAYVAPPTSEEPFAPSEDLSNLFRYREWLGALYAQVERSEERFNYAVGLRAESLVAEGSSSRTESILDRQQTFLFPFLSGGYTFSEKFGINLALNSRIQRPSYENLNPFVIIHDPFTRETGDPLLASARTYNLVTKFNYRGNPLLELGATQVNDFIVQLPLRQPGGEILGITTNIDRRRQYRVSGYYPLRFGPKLNGYGGVASYWTEYQDSELALDEFRQNFTAFAQVQYTISDSWNIKANGWATTGGLEGPVDLDALAGLGLTARYAAQPGARYPITMTFGSNDLLNIASTGAIVHHGNPLLVRNRGLAPQFFASLRYDFGEQLQRKDQRRSGGQREKNRINWDQ